MEDNTINLYLYFIKAMKGDKHGLYTTDCKMEKPAYDTLCLLAGKPEHSRHVVLFVLNKDVEFQSVDKDNFCAGVSEGFKRAAELLKANLEKQQDLLRKLTTAKEKAFILNQVKHKSMGWAWRLTALSALAPKANQPEEPKIIEEFVQGDQPVEKMAELLAKAFLKLTQRGEENK